jgi:hypothetical protein
MCVEKLFATALIDHKTQTRKIGCGMIYLSFADIGESSITYIIGSRLETEHISESENQQM